MPSPTCPFLDVDMELEPTIDHDKSQEGSAKRKKI
jgi:hypothetical protein